MDRRGSFLAETLFVTGQSVAARFLTEGGPAFRAKLAELAPELGRVTLSGLTIGGSVSSFENYFPNNKDGQERQWWWNPADNTPGPALEKAIAKAKASTRINWSAIVFDLGQHEAFWKALGSPREFVDIAASYEFAVPKVLASLRLAIRPEDPDSLPILFVPLADQQPTGAIRRAHEFGPFRAMQHRIAASIVNCYLVGNVMAMEMQDMLHPSKKGVEFYAGRVAEKYAWVRKQELRVARELFTGSTHMAASEFAEIFRAFGLSPRHMTVLLKLPGGLRQFQKMLAGVTPVSEAVARRMKLLRQFTEIMD